MKRSSRASFIDNGVKRVLVASPHCYHTFKNEYPEFMVNFDVVHISQFLQELIEQGRLEFNGEYDKKVAFHDPCYLGRHNGIYDQPRDVLKKVPGLELVEMPDSRGNSLCCGGGGGRIWAETPKEERFSDLRVAQAVEVGAEVLATACPYCISNFEESALSLEEKSKIEIRDITEVLFEALSENGGAS
jgi:Fe-S oxidoreductase